METYNAYAGMIVNSVNHIMDSFTSIKIASSDIRIPMKRCSPSGVTVHIGIVGDIEAMVLMSVNQPTSMALASEMMGGMEMMEVDELVLSAVAEFCNIVIGNACTGLNGHQMAVDITPPVIISNGERQAADSSYNIAIHLCELGDIDFDIALKKAI